MKLLYSFLFMIMLLPFTSALTSGEGTILFGAIFSMLVIVVFFLTISIIIKGPMKVFFVGLSFLTIVASVGFGVSIMQQFFSDFTVLINSYGNFYLLMLILSLAGLFALILWLIIVALKTFNSYRGLTDEE